MIEYVCRECGQKAIKFQVMAAWDPTSERLVFDGPPEIDASICTLCEAEGSAAICRPGPGLVMDAGGGEGRILYSGTLGEDGFDLEEDIGEGGLTLARWLEIAVPGSACDATRLDPGVGGNAEVKTRLIFVGRAADIAEKLGLEVPGK